jgi:hypothetical protein
VDSISAQGGHDEYQSDAPKSPSGAFWQWKDHPGDLVIRRVIWISDMRRRLRFTLRVLLVLVALAALPCWWVGSQLTQYRFEQSALARIRKVAPKLHVEYTSKTPAWLSRMGIRPTWLERVTDIDVTGTTGGRNVSADEIPLDFDDTKFAAILDDLRKFSQLNELYFQLTRLSDSSLPKLREFERVKFINLQQTAATSLGVKKLESEMPNTKIAFFHDLTDPWQ